MLAIIAISEELKASNHAAWIDCDRMGAPDLLERLRQLGVTDDQVREHMTYYAPTTEGTQEDVDELATRLREKQARLCVIDAFDPALALFNLDPNSTIDVDNLFHALIHPLSQTGAAIVIIDHVAKNTESRGMFSIGSQRKTSAVDVAIGVETIGNGISRGREGRAKIKIHRDRRGFSRAGTYGNLVINSYPNGVLTWRIDKEPDHPAGEAFRFTGIMEKISRYLEDQPDNPSKNSIEKAIDTKAVHTRAALTTLSDEGFVKFIDGPRNATLVSLQKAYRQLDDPACDKAQEHGQIDPELDLVPLRPDFVPDEVEANRSTSSRQLSPPPKGGRGGTNVEWGEPDELEHDSTSSRSMYDPDSPA